MWRLQLKNKPEQQFLFTCMGISAGVHLALIAILFLADRSNYYVMTVTSTAIDTNVPIVFLPMPSAAHLRKKNGKALAGAVSGAAKKNGNSASVAKRARTIVADNTPAVRKGKEKKKKNTSKKGTAKKEPAPKQKDTEKKVVEKIPEKIKEAEPAKPVAEPLPVALVESAAVVASSAVVENAVAQPADNVLYVGYDELDVLQKEEYIRQEVANVWSPPKGLPHDLQCLLKIMVGAEGTVDQVDVESPSGVPMFDMSARMAMLLFMPPQWAYGKTLLITFKE